MTFTSIVIVTDESDSSQRVEIKIVGLEGDITK